MDLVVCEIVITSYFNPYNCAYLHDWFDLVLLSVSIVFGRNLLAHLKQTNEKLKGDIWLLDCSIRPNVTFVSKERFVC